MGSDSYLSDFHSEPAVKLRMPSSFTCDDYVNVVSGMVSNGLENKEESKSNALELAKLVETQELFIKEEHANVEEEAPRIFAEEEQDDFPELSFLRGDCMVNSSNIGIGAEVEYMSRIFNDGRDSDCESSFLTSLRLNADCSLVDVDGDLCKRGDGFFSPPLLSKCTVTSVISNGSSMEGRKRILPNLESYKSNFDSCSDNVTNMDDKTKDDNQLFSVQNGLGMPLQYARKLKETHQVNNFASSLEINTSHKKVEEDILGVGHVDHEASCSAQGSTSEPTYCSAAEKSTSEKLSSGELDIKGSTFDCFKRTSTCCSVDNDCCTEEENVPGVIANSCSITSVRRSNPKRGASLRSNLSDGKYNPPIRIQSDRKKCRKNFGSSTSCMPTTLKMFSGVKRQMRNSHRKARLSIWGTIESLFTIIKQRDELINHDSVPNPARKSRSKKSGCGVNQRKMIAARKNKLSRVSSTKLLLSRQSIHPRMLDAQPSLENGIENFITTSDFHASSGTSSTKVELEQNLAEQWYAVVRSNMREGQQVEKDLESTLTQETSADNLLSESHGVSSCVDFEFVAETVDNKNLSDPGNSPDSDVYNPLIDVGNLTFEGSTFIKKDFASIKNNRVHESKDEDDLPSATPKPFVVRLPFLKKQMQSSETLRSPKKSHKGKKKLKQKKEKKGKLENKWKREKIGNKTCQISECPFLLSDPPGEGSLDCQAKSNEVKKASLSCSCTLKGKGACDIGSKYSKISKKHCKIRSNPDTFLITSVSELADLDKFNHYLKVQNRTKASKCTLQNEGNEQLEAIPPSGYDKECQVSESAKMGLRKNKSNHSDSTRHRRKFIFNHQKENIMKSDELRKVDGFPNENDHLDFSLGTTNNVSLLGGEIAAVDVLLKNVTKDVATPISNDSARETFNICMGQSSFSGKKAWALCDDCQKWRCVPDELVHVIEKDRWTCKDNVDEAFADCTIPQEKTDEEINNDLGILDEQHCSTALHNYGEPAPPRLSAKTQTSWTRIKSNLFLHRNRRTQTIDEIMVCHCKPPPDGGLGCGEECLNRMLNIECVKGTCPCGNLCSNQQFQKRKYAKFKWLKCGKKGFGLQLEDNVSKGEFLIEYVGEVLDLAAYETRLRNYACRGQKHFYFMTLNGGEVIDACDKGNLGRFINHSCDPNCRTEKWMVNGEVCIGLFAIRDIKKGEEITFDYNYVRVFGAAAKKCVCGSAECRGYIGGDPSSSEVIVQDDSDTEDLEPVVIEDGEIELGVEIDSVATGAKVANNEILSVKRNETQENPSMSEQGVCEENNGLEDQDAIHQLSSKLDRTHSLMQSSCVEIKSNMCKISDIQSLQEGKLGLSSIEPVQNVFEEVNEGPPLSTFYKSLPAGQLSERPEHNLNILPQTDHTLIEPILDVATKVSSQNSGSLIHRSSATCPSEEIQSASKTNNVVKASRHVKIKRSRVSIRSGASGKTKKLSTAITSRHIEGVEEILNELLDEDGGIYRKKDAAKRYLKLLLVTAAAGDETKGSMSQSARDLSMILDAILKTKSRMVLKDIINKNGLQMLHNMMKQNRDNFNRTPILRKLLKVLEFLAEKEILTKDHIFAAAPCSGMESFKESMLKLMKHNDIQVHLIARNFAEQWIPRTFQRVNPSDRDDRQLCPNFLRPNWCQTSKVISWHDHNKFSASNCQPSSDISMRGEALSFPSQAVSSSTSFTEITPMEIVSSRKRKSRWDQPSDANEQASDCLEEQVMLCSSSSSMKYMRPSPLEPISDIEVPKQKPPTKSEGNNSFDELIGDDNNDDDEMPPGFGSCKDDLPVASASTDMNGEAVVIGHLQERYLAHLTVSYGMPIALMQQQETADPSLKIAPAMPFKPFPPLPSYPRQGPYPSYATNRPFINRNTNYRQPRQRAGFPKYGNGRRFFQPQQQNHHRPLRF